MTVLNDTALEAAARAMYRVVSREDDWDTQRKAAKEYCRRKARAAVTAYLAEVEKSR